MNKHEERKAMKAYYMLARKRKKRYLNWRANHFYAKRICPSNLRTRTIYRIRAKMERED